ncbi:tetratricopeptide repeat protein [Streptomyces sp. NPDC056479]|uniref:tetratricopeptide repeat protein n=1 Tax=Streptomyces sp. NPDC056479 TaxID=3345832 RepID=UPI0036A1764A
MTSGTSSARPESSDDEGTASTTGSAAPLASSAPVFAADSAHGSQVNSSGGNTQINIHGTASRPDLWPVVIGALPALASAFQPRSRLRDQLVTGSRLAPGMVPTQVLVGGGGAGKSQLAASFAYRALDPQGNRRDVVIWATAVSRESVQLTYAEAARRLAIPGTTGDDVVHDAQVLLAWLTVGTRSWLVVLDDIADMRDVDDLWPRGPGDRGHVVATTRRKEPTLSGGGRSVVDVRTFRPEESAAYLRQRLSSSGFGHLLDASVDDLAEALGHLPLALSHAAAYLIRKQRLTCTDYLQRYVQESASLAELLPGWADTEAYGRPIVVTLTLGLEAAAATPPLGAAQKVLQMAALLDPAGHPMRLWDTAAAAAQADPTGDAVRPYSPEDVWETCLALHSYGLLHIDSAGGPRALGVHAVTARAVRESADPDQLGQAAEAAADALAEIWPTYTYLDADLVAVLRANVEALSRVAGDHLWTSERFRLLYRAGDSLFDVGLQAAAIGYWTKMAESASRFLGPDHPEVLAARARIGRAQGHAGDPATAVRTLGQVADEQSRLLGPEHPSTLTSLQDLARWRGHAGDAGGALAATQEVLTTRQSVLGLLHPDTLASRATLARWRGETGDAAAAAKGLEEVFEDMLTTLGADHPATLKARNNLGYWRGEAGDAAGAARALEALLEDRLRVLGPDQPDTLNTRNNVAYWRGEAGDSAGAARALEQLLGDRTRILGADHPHTLATRSNLAYWRGKAGDAEGAVGAFRDLLRDRIKVLGPDHPDVLDTRANLARWSGEADGPADAPAAFNALLIDRLRVLGPDHPDTLTTRHEVARWSGHAGDPDTAVRGLGDVLPDRLRILGADHPDTMATRHELARWQAEAGDLEAGLTGLAAVLADRLRVLGTEHPHTLVSYAELGRWRAEAGDIAGALSALRSAADGRSRILGEGHPETRATRAALDRLRQSGGCS